MPGVAGRTAEWTIATSPLPYTAAVLVHHGRAGLAVECFLKLGHVRDHAVRPVLFRRVRVDRGAEALSFIATLAAPALAVADEEALLRR